MITVILENPNTGDIYDLPFTTIQIDEELNVGETCRIQFDYRAVEKIANYYSIDVIFLLSGGLRKLSVKKDDVNIFLGYVSDMNVSKDNKDGLKLDIAAVGQFVLLSKRRTINKRTFTATDAGQIAWTLIDETQQSDLPYSDIGITQGLIQPSVNRDIVYRFADIRQEISKLSNNYLKDGFDFDIDNNGVFNVFYPTKGTQRPNIVMDEANIVAWGVRKPLVLSLANKVNVVGSGFNDTVVYSVRDSANAYKTSFGLLEEFISDRNINDTVLLDDKGDKFLLDYQSPILGITITHLDGQPDIFDYELGDSLKLYISEVNISNTYKRVYKRSMRIDSNSKMVVVLEVK